MGVDPLAIHPLHRGWCDAIRSLVGRCLASVDWSYTINALRFQTYFSAKEQLAFWEIINELLLITQSQNTCHHQYPVLESSSGIELRAYSDASTYGGSIEIDLIGEKETSFPLKSDLWRWSTRERNYHTNRLEGISLLKCLSALDSLISYYRTTAGSGIQNEKTISVTVFTDNVSSLAWALSGVTRSDGIEKRATTRLAAALHEEVNELSKKCDFKLLHVAGEKNQADSGSRFYTKLADVLNGLHKRKTHLDRVNQINESSPLSPPVSLVDDACLEFGFSASLPIRYVAITRYVFRKLMHLVDDAYPMLPWPEGVIKEYERMHFAAVAQRHMSLTAIEYPLRIDEEGIVHSRNSRPFRRRTQAVRCPERSGTRYPDGFQQQLIEKADTWDSTLRSRA